MQSAAAEAETPVGERSDTKTMACVAPLPPIVRPSAAQLITSSPWRRGRAARPSSAHLRMTEHKTTNRGRRSDTAGRRRDSVSHPPQRRRARDITDRRHAARTSPTGRTRFAGPITLPARSNRTPSSSHTYIGSGLFPSSAQVQPRYRVLLHACHVDRQSFSETERLQHQAPSVALHVRPTRKWGTDSLASSTTHNAIYQ